MSTAATPSAIPLKELIAQHRKLIKETILTELSRLVKEEFIAQMETLCKFDIEESTRIIKKIIKEDLEKFVKGEVRSSHVRDLIAQNETYMKMSRDEQFDFLWGKAVHRSIKNRGETVE